jgi:PEP-CTERM motif
MKTLISIGSIAIGSIALNLMPVQQAQAIDLGFTSATTTTEAFYGAVGYAGLGTGTAPTISSKTLGGWTSDGYNVIVSSSANLSTNVNVAAEDGSSVNFYGSTLPAPVGTHFVAADSAYLTGRIYQDLTGLEVGATYTISYYQAAAQQYEIGTGNYSGATTDNWIANVGGTYTAPTYSGGSADYGSNLTTGGFTGGTTHESATMSLGSQAAAGSQTVAGGAPVVNGWQQDSFAFTATSANTTTDAATGVVSSRLSFLAKGAPNGKPPFALLAGVSASKIPEPGTYVGTLLGLGLLGTVVKSRLTKKKLDDRN